MKFLKITFRIIGYAALVFCAAELIARLIVPVSLTRQISVPHMFESDPTLGYRLRRDMVTNVRAWDGKKNLFQTQYRTDSFGRRIVHIEAPERRAKHFIILGGSTVFGMGLRDEDTLAHFLAVGTHNHLPFNYAGDGYGPQNAYALAKGGLLQREVPEAEGHTVFFFQMLNQTGGHIQTLLGRFELLLDGWGENLPMYSIRPGQAPQSRGLMRDFAPFKFQSFRFLQNFHALNVSYPKLVPISADEINATVEFMKAVRDEVVVTKPKTRFSIVIHPLSDRHATKSVVDAFRAAGLVTIDMSTLVPEEKIDEFIAFSRYFPHPNRALNETFAKALIEELKLD